MKSAEIACGELFALTSSVLGVNMDSKIAASYQHIRRLVAAGHLSEVSTRDSSSMFAQRCYQLPVGGS